MKPWGPDAPMAIKGLISYRYRGLFGWVMIGAKDDADALVQAKRSLCGGRAVLDKLQVWSGTEYVDVQDDRCVCTRSYYCNLCATRRKKFREPA